MEGLSYTSETRYSDSPILQYSDFLSPGANMILFGKRIPILFSLRCGL